MKILGIRSVSTPTLQRLLGVLREFAPRTMGPTILAIEEELLRRWYEETLCNVSTRASERGAA